MTESERPMKRLLEQANSPLEGALLLAGNDVKVSEATRAAVLEAIGLGGRRSRIRALPFGRMALLLAAMVISAAAVAIPLAEQVISGSYSAPDATTSDIEAEPEVVASRHRPAADEPDQETASIESLPLELEDEPIRQVAPRTGSARTARNLLAAELAALDAVRAKLGSGDARAALVLLDAYQREFPKARLSLEAEVLRIDALDRAGHVEAARRRAAAFVQNHPKGVLTGRVKRYLER
jgi:hypothetical protein